MREETIPINQIDLLVLIRAIHTFAQAANWFSPHQFNNVLNLSSET